MFSYFSSQKALWANIFISIVLFFLGLCVNYQANAYTASHVIPGVVIHDIILDHLPVVDVDDIVFEGVVVFIAFVIALMFEKPSRAPMIIKTSALFVIVRSFFIILTHVAPPVHESYVLVSNSFERLIAGSGDDLFFSGHTGFPFLMALLLWNKPLLRVLFIITSIVFGAAVLLGHLHYSIDVFAAFFITYGIYDLATVLFPSDFKMLLEAK